MVVGCFPVARFAREAREREILTLMAQQVRSNRAMCDELELSPKTVETHRRVALPCPYGEPDVAS
ncbi:MAG: hypothetical protein H0U69_01175 [Trueperaceae bacterium]|nr:hypothetical protein [Trueperaceae bacterium]